MSISLDELQSMRDELQRARFSGALRVRFKDRDVTYKNDADMAKAIAAIDAEINKGTPKPGFSLTDFADGTT